MIIYSHGSHGTHYLQLSSKSIVETRELIKDVLVVDLAADGTLVGVDIQAEDEEQPIGIEIVEGGLA